MLPGAKPATRGACSFRKYSSVPVFFDMPPCFTSRTTPTMVKGGALGAEERVEALADRLELADCRRTSSRAFR